MKMALMLIQWRWKTTVSPFCSSSPPESFLPPLSPEQPAKYNDDNDIDDNYIDDNNIDANDDKDDLPPSSLHFLQKY